MTEIFDFSKIHSNRLVSRRESSCKTGNIRANSGTFRRDSSSFPRSHHCVFLLSKRSKFFFHRGIAQLVEQRSPKPRAEGSSPSAPAKNREASIVLASLFFVSAHKDSATRCGCAPRSACRGALVACGALPRTDRGGSRDKSDVYLCLFSHPSAPAAPPSSTQNAPGFAFFGLNRVRFAVFALF